MSRRAHDFYPTVHEWATDELLKRVKVGGCVLEPCSGAHHMTRQLQKGGLEVVTNDLYTDDADFRLDAAGDELWRAIEPDWVVSNPPFNLAPVIVPKAVAHAKIGCAFLLRITFGEPCKNRAEFLSTHPPDAFFWMPRMSFTEDGKTDNCTCGWFVWSKHALALPEQRIQVIAPWLNAA